MALYCPGKKYIEYLMGTASQKYSLSWLISSLLTSLDSFIPTPHGLQCFMKIVLIPLLLCGYCLFSGTFNHLFFKKKYTEIQLIHNIILVSDILHSGVVFTYIKKMISTISLETMHPHIVIAILLIKFLTLYIISHGLFIFFFLACLNLFIFNWNFTVLYQFLPYINMN